MTYHFERTVTRKSLLKTLLLKAKTNFLNINDTENNYQHYCFPQLSLLTDNALAMKKAIPSLLKDTAIVAVQHNLKTTGSLYETLHKIFDLPYTNIYTLGKIYSNSPRVTNQLKNLGVYIHDNKQPTTLGNYKQAMDKDIAKLWYYFMSHVDTTKIKNVIILDDGGACISMVPKWVRDNFNVMGIEQTTYGVKLLNKETLNFPVINVANCAAKYYLESSLIAESITAKLKSYALLKNKNIPCGVIGCGAIGEAVINTLHNMGHKVYCYDLENNKNFHPDITKTDTIDELLHKADIYFGCTPGDALSSIDIDQFIKTINRTKYAISCSSGDEQYLSLLKEISKHTKQQADFNPLDDIKFKTPKAEVIVKRGGFPFNFDNSGTAVPSQKIALTRGLLMHALTESWLICENYNYDQVPKQLIKLNALSQSMTVNSWAQHGNTLQQKMLHKFNDSQFIDDNSQGLHQAITLPVFERIMTETVS